MIVDAHLHIWRSAPAPPNPVKTFVSASSDVPLELLADYMAEHSVDRAVLVQPLYPGEDNSYVADCAAAEPEKYAAVCVIDPRSAGAEDKLAHWVQERGCKGLRLRPRVPSEAASFGQSETFPIWERAVDLGVVINILADPPHLKTVGALARRFSQVNVVLDHMGHPNPAAGIDSPDFQALLDLAELPNVWVKPTGYYYYSAQRYPYADCHHLFRGLYDHFGARRLMWGSDFPHVLLTTGYRRNLLMQERIYPYLSDTDRDQIMGGNARALYWAE